MVPAPYTLVVVVVHPQCAVVAAVMTNEMFQIINCANRIYIQRR